MKFNKILSIVGLSLVLVISSCESTLEVKPDFVLEGSLIYKNLGDYERALTGTYALFRQTGYFGSGGQTTSTWGTLPDMMGEDLVRTAEDLANWIRQVNWNYAADEADLEIAWISAYTVISQANLTLRNIDQFAATNQQAVNRIKGQALAIRGMVHFDLLRFWGEEYTRNSTALGIPYVEIVDAYSKPSRLTVEESYDKIFADLNLAETLLADIDSDINTSSSRAYIDEIVVQALLSRVYLYSGNYAQAENYATLVINQIPLAPQEEFAGIWSDNSLEEVIWSVTFNLGEGVPGAGIHIASSNRNRFKPSDALLAAFDQTNDVRYDSYFAVRDLAGTPRNIISKFYARNTAPPTAGDNLVDWKAFRTGEMYLIRAEARALQVGKEALALADLNELRAARISNYIPEVLAGSALIDAIAFERRKELIGEGHRWFDLKRTTKTITRLGSDGQVGGTPLTLASNAREWTWPIPTTEINSNQNIAADQTTGY